ncbi:hypothetical protein INR49_001538 [Caranx melampygus]|nr:hypothetical protein INR49_001538 [Caranx melampygus]
MGFGFLSMTNREGVPLDEPVDVFVHQSKLHMEGFRSLKEGEAVEFTFKKSSKGLESQRVTGPDGIHCLGSERRPKGKKVQKRRSKGDSIDLDTTPMANRYKAALTLEAALSKPHLLLQWWQGSTVAHTNHPTPTTHLCYNCGGLDHHAKECKLPPQPKKCHFCQSIDHMVANCPIKAQQSSPGSQGKASSLKGDEEEHSHSALPPETSD